MDKLLPHPPPPEKEMPRSAGTLRGIMGRQLQGNRSLAHSKDSINADFQILSDRVYLVALRLTGWVPR